VDAVHPLHPVHPVLVTPYIFYIDDSDLTRMIQTHRKSEKFIMPVVVFAACAAAAVCCPWI
jgi:hypothetical protein